MVVAYIDVNEIIGSETIALFGSMSTLRNKLLVTLAKPVAIEACLTQTINSARSSLKTHLVSVCS